MTKQLALLQSLPFDTSVLAGRVGPSTVLMYTRDFKAYLAYVQTVSQQSEDVFNASTLEQWITHLVSQTRKSPNTINRMVSAVKKMMQRAAKEGYLSHEVAEAFAHVEGVKQVSLKHRMRIRNRVRIEPRLMRKIISSFDTQSLTGLRNRAMFTTLASSGLRVHELVTLQPQQILEKRGGYALHIYAEEGKNLTEDREAHISVEAVQAIRAWLAARPIESPYIFTSFEVKGGGKPLAKHISEAGAWKIVKYVFHRHGLENVKPHDLRRFVATQLIKHGDIRKAQKALGHKRLETTAKYDLNELEIGATDNLF